MVHKNLNCLLRARIFYTESKSKIHTTGIINESPIKPKQVEVKKFIDEKKQKFCDRLYVWGYAGVGALG